MKLNLLGRRSSWRVTVRGFSYLTRPSVLLTLQQRLRRIQSHSLSLFLLSTPKFRTESTKKLAKSGQAHQTQLTRYINSRFSLSAMLTLYVICSGTLPRKQISTVWFVSPAATRLVVAHILMHSALSGIHSRGLSRNTATIPRCRSHKKRCRFRHYTT